jgi:heat shock protein HslJ
MRKRALRTLITAAAVAAVVVGGGTLLTGCSDNGSSLPAELAGTWLLQAFSLDDGNTIVIDDPQSYTIDFSTGNRANIKADCNVCNGMYFLDGDMLRFDTMACTRVACAPGSLGSAYVSALVSTSRYEIVDGRLVLDYEGGNMSFTPRGN